MSVDFYKYLRELIKSDKSVDEIDDEVIELLENSADFDINHIYSDTGMSLLHYACIYELPKTVGWLLSKPNINVNIENKYGSTPLITYCDADFYVDPNIVRDLLRSPGIDVNKVNKDGNTALSACCDGRHTEIVDILLNDDRVNINISNNNGYTPFMLACEENYVDIIELFLTKRTFTLTQLKSALDVVRGNTEARNILNREIKNYNVVNQAGAGLRRTIRKQKRSTIKNKTRRKTNKP